VNYDALGYDVTAVIRLSIEPASLAAVVERLKQQDALTTVYEVTGTHDVIAIGTFADTDAMNELAASLVTAPGIEETTADVVRDVACENAPLDLDAG